MIPVLAAAVLFGGASALAIWGGSHLALAAVGDATSGWGELGTWILRILFWAVGIVIAFVIAMSLAQPVSGFALDAIARKQELARSGRTWPDQPFVAGALRSLRVSLTALAIGLPILGVLGLITVLVPPAAFVTIPLKFLVTGLLVAYDLLDYPLSQRGLSVAERMVFMRRNFASVLGFGVAAAALLLVPGMALFLLPFGVAGATRIVLEAERFEGDSRVIHPR